MKEILKNIQTKITEVQAVKYVDEDWGQLNLFPGDLPVQFPCVLCDIKGNKADYIFKDFGQFEYNFKDYYILFNINQSTFVEKSTLDSIKVCFKLQRKYYLKLRQAISENFSKQGVDLYK